MHALRRLLHFVPLETSECVCVFYIRGRFLATSVKKGICNLSVEFLTFRLFSFAVCYICFRGSHNCHSYLKNGGNSNSNNIAYTDNIFLRNFYLETYLKIQSNFQRVLPCTFKLWRQLCFAPKGKKPSTLLSLLIRRKSIVGCCLENNGNRRSAIFAVGIRRWVRNTNRIVSGERDGCRSERVSFIGE